VVGIGKSSALLVRRNANNRDARLSVRAQRRARGRTRTEVQARDKKIWRCSLKNGASVTASA
jgi:hypothetical protein